MLPRQPNPDPRLTFVIGDVIGKDQCEKLRKCIMNIDTAKTVDELLKLTIAVPMLTASMMWSRAPS